MTDAAKALVIEAELLFLSAFEALDSMLGPVCLLDELCDS